MDHAQQGIIALQGRRVLRRLLAELGIIAGRLLLERLHVPQGIMGRVLLIQQVVVMGRAQQGMHAQQDQQVQHRLGAQQGIIVLLGRRV